MAEMVSGMQHLLDATLRHQTLHDILPDLIRRVRDVLDAEAATIFLAEEESGSWWWGRRAWGWAARPRPARSVSARDAGRIAAQRRPELLQNPGSEDLVDPGLRELGLQSLIGAPLQARGRLTGVIQVGSASRRLTDEDLGLLRLAADRVALAIDHVQLYEREHRIAETLQRSLLPERLPQLGAERRGALQPAAAEAEVGGDWYDVIPIPGGRVGLVMGDVAGKGLGPRRWSAGCAAPCARTPSKAMAPPRRWSSSTGSSGPSSTRARWPR